MIEKIRRTTERLWRMRGLLRIAASRGGNWWVWPSIDWCFVGAFDFEPLSSFLGCRRIAAEETSAAPSPLIGDIRLDDAELSALVAAARNAVCGVLSGNAPCAGVRVIWSETTPAA